MTVQFYEILTAAQKILKTADCEAGYRAVLGRAYYAAYHGSLIFHNSLSSPGSVGAEGGGKHDTLCRQLQTPTIPTGPLRIKSIQLGHMCKTLLTARIKADYWLDDSVTDENARANVMLAEKAVELLNG